MARRLLGFLGLVMLAAPRRVVAVAESLAFENPDDAVLRDWTLPIARGEGLAYLLLARRARGSSALGVLLGVVAGAATVAPRQYLACGLGFAYENPEDTEVKPWVVPFARVLGLLYLYAALKTVRGRDDTTTGTEDSKEKATVGA